MPTQDEFVPQRILLCHAYYRQRGGEDESFEAEANLLEKRGHKVVRYTFDNHDTSNWSTWQIATKGFWNQRVFTDVRQLLQQHAIQLVHCTNLFPFMSGSIYYAARRQHIPVVQALRNYRLTCVNSLLLYQDKVCFDCIGSTLAWHGIQRGCYRNSHVASTIVATQSALQRWLGVQRHLVDWYFTLRTSHDESKSKRVFLKNAFRSNQTSSIRFRKSDRAPVTMSSSWDDYPKRKAFAVYWKLGNKIVRSQA